MGCGMGGSVGWRCGRAAAPGPAMLRNPSLSLKAGGLGPGAAISCWPRYQGVHGEHEDLFMPALGWLRRGGV